MFSTNIQTMSVIVTKYWLPLPILKENEAADTSFLEKSDRQVRHYPMYRILSLMLLPIFQ